MRKLSVYLLTAATALAAAGAVPATAYAATGTYNIPGGKMIVIGGGMNGASCDPLLPGMPGINFPGINVPGVNIPDNSLPLPIFPIPDHPDNTTPDQPEVDGSQDEFASQVAKLVNEERAKASLSPLTVHAGAADAAFTRAKELETSFSHTRPNEGSFNSALTEAGVRFTGAGENIAYGQNSPEKVMESWMNSSGHRANILSANYTSIGVGHYKNAAGVDYWTQLFIQ